MVSRLLDDNSRRDGLSLETVLTFSRPYILINDNTHVRFVTVKLQFFLSISLWCKNITVLFLFGDDRQCQISRNKMTNILKFKQKYLFTKYCILVCIHLLKKYLKVCILLTAAVIDLMISLHYFVWPVVHICNCLRQNKLIARESIALGFCLEKKIVFWKLHRYISWVLAFYTEPPHSLSWLDPEPEVTYKVLDSKQFQIPDWFPKYKIRCRRSLQCEM